jgi:hypothetical protein
MRLGSELRNREREPENHVEKTPGTWAFKGVENTQKSQVLSEVIG